MIELRDVSHSYVSEGRTEVTYTHVLHELSVAIPRRQFVSIVGASGCGKTTTLRLIAGLLRPWRGQVLLDGRPVPGPGPDRALVFQHAGLYPWLTVEANVRFGLEVSGLARGSDARERAGRYMSLVGLTEFADHYPRELSGGMQQRVGLARALAVSPDTLLMDEPFGSLDAITRRRMGAELLDLWERDQRTVVFVTHSLDEALTLSDRVLVMREGKIVCDEPVGLPRPRDFDAVAEDAAFLDLRRRLWELL